MQEEEEDWSNVEQPMRPSEVSSQLFLRYGVAWPLILKASLLSVSGITLEAPCKFLQPKKRPAIPVASLLFLLLGGAWASGQTIQWGRPIGGLEAGGDAAGGR